MGKMWCTGGYETIEKNRTLEDVWMRGWRGKTRKEREEKKK